MQRRSLHQNPLSNFESGVEPELCASIWCLSFQTVRFSMGGTKRLHGLCLAVFYPSSDSFLMASCTPYHIQTHSIIVKDAGTSPLSPLPEDRTLAALLGGYCPSNVFEYGVCIGFNRPSILIYRSTTSLIVAMPFRCHGN